ncbi:zinc finger protein 2 [Niveomyces insectorum RCEF 264]|uniref:Zinc finger protein 2 n=1 Tax=Niveomyces insectorum RCEF 264 TaxID=1081102 RepID=A0A167LT92_9HYPO|nr:zinc finger protein 2 [Niveomyces insectorum RCEF 264]
MAPSTPSGQLLARSLSHGGIAGAVVGSVMGAMLLFLLFLPFILRAFRNARYRRKIAAENAEMGLIGPGGYYYGPGATAHPSFYQPGEAQTGAGAAAGVVSPPSPSAAPAKTLADNNSSEDGKAGAPPSPPLPAATAAAAADRHALPPGATALNTNLPTSAATASQPPASPPPPLGSSATFPAFKPQPFAPRQRSATMRSVRSSSFAQALEGLAGRAASLFHQESTRSASTRSPSVATAARPPVEHSRSPFGVGYDESDPNNHHMWMIAQQGNYGEGISPTEAALFDIEAPPMSGTAAEYYGGAPLSPPTDPSSSFMAPISYAPTPPSLFASSLANMASAAAVAGVASSPDTAKPPKPAARTDSLRTATTTNDFSPLPLSPISPPTKVQDAFPPAGATEMDRGVIKEEPGEDEAARAAATSSTLTPEPVEFMPRSPSYRPLVPSPQLPAPGTVNPRDVWAPATDDERFVHKTAELDRIERSPPPMTTVSSQKSSPSPPPLDAGTPAPLLAPTPASAPASAPTPVSASSPMPSSRPAPPGEDVKNEGAEETETLPASTQFSGTQYSDVQFSDVPSAPQGNTATTSFESESTPASSNATNEFAPESFVKPDPYDGSYVTMDAGANGKTTTATDFGAANGDYEDYTGINVNFAFAGEMLNYTDNNGVQAVGDGGKMATEAYVQQQQQQQQPSDDYYNNNNISNNSNSNGSWSGPNGIPTIEGPYMTPTPPGQYPDGILFSAPTTTAPDLTYAGNGSFGQTPLYTPQTSPGRVPHTNGNQLDFYASGSNNAQSMPVLVGNASLPVTPAPPSRAASTRNTPLSVPGSDLPSRPVSPLSNAASTPGHLSSSSPRSFACDECGRAFDQIHKLNHHKRYHDRPHECTVANCGMRFGTKTHLDRHVNDKHSKSRKYHCTEEGCPYSVPGGKSFPRKDNWRRHMVNKHGVHPDHDPIEVIDQPMMG